MNKISVMFFFVCLIGSAHAKAFVYECQQHVGNDTVELSGDKNGLQLKSNLNKRIHGTYVRRELPPQARVVEYSKVTKATSPKIDVVNVTFREALPQDVISGKTDWFFALIYLYDGEREESLSYSCDLKSSK